MHKPRDAQTTLRASESALPSVYLIILTENMAKTTPSQGLRLPRRRVPPIGAAPSINRG